jgi:galactoside O-acetyltransferase
MAMLDINTIMQMGFKKAGKNIQISDKAAFYNAGNISIGDNTRIDDFCVISAGEGGIEIGRNVHIAVYVSLIGKGKITVGDFANFSSRIAVYSSNDDYSGEFMTNPTVDEEFTNVTHADVFIGKHVIIGTGSVILPGITIEEGASIGSLSLVKNNCESFGIYAGIPAKFIKKRSDKLLDQERKLSERAKN